MLMDSLPSHSKQGRIHGNPVADSWTGAVMRKLLAIQNVTEGQMDKPTDRQSNRVRD